MRRDYYSNNAGRVRHWRHRNAVVMAKRRDQGVPLSKRSRIAERDQRLPFIPPEDWHEPREEGKKYRILVKDPGKGYRHILTPQEVQQRLSDFPQEVLNALEVVQMSRMTRKKRGFPCYGMQWGASIYLYPIEEDLVEYYECPPKPSQKIEAAMYGGRWVQEVGNQGWKLIWTESALKDFYLNNILIHELAHLLDDRNTTPVDRERFAEWFAVQYGYKATRRLGTSRPPVVKRHHR